MYTTDGGGDTTDYNGPWAAAGTLTDDIVLEQTEYQYDADGDVIFTISRQRFHDDPLVDSSGVHNATGALGDVGGHLPDGTTVAPKARAYYSEAFYDAGNRVTGTANLGTNGGTSLTERPDSLLPSSSSTIQSTAYTYNSAGLTDTVTDPKGIVTKTIYDALCRTTRTIENYLDGTAGNSGNGDDDRTTTYTYDGSGHTLTMTATNAGHPDQTTAYIYGVSQTGSHASALDSNDLLAEVRYPNKTTGLASSSPSDQEVYAYDTLGAVVIKIDENQTTHTYTYDSLGRLTVDHADVAAGNPWNIDTSIVTLKFTYGTQGLLETAMSYDGSNYVVTGEQRSYDGFGRLIVEWQTGGIVFYNYSSPADTPNASRLISIEYPGGKRVLYRYGLTAGDLDDRISRLTAIAEPNVQDGGVNDLEEYSYLGLSTVVKRIRPAGNSQLSLISSSTGDAGDKYAGLDRFGRVIDQNWTKLVSESTATLDDFKYGYDADGNVVYKKNGVLTSDSELYNSTASTDTSTFYDGLSRLTGFQRGTLNSYNNALTGSASETQSFAMDQLGNMQSDTSGSATRLYNARNQMTFNGTNTVYYDNDGNTIDDGAGKLYTYDAWNHAIQIKDSNNSSTLESFQYDALGRRVVESSPVSGGTRITTHAYSSQWQVLEDNSEVTDGSGYGYGYGSAPVHTHDQYVWSQFYVDDLITRDSYVDGSLSSYAYGGSEGISFGDSGLSPDDPQAMTVGMNGDTYVLTHGYGTNGYDDNNPYVILAYAGGNLDTSFNSTGKLILTGLGLKTATAITTDAEGDILIAGVAWTSSTDATSFELVRFTLGGQLDTRFNSAGTPGYVRSPDAVAPNSPVAILRDPETGAMIIVGSRTSAGHDDLALARFTANGIADATFGTSGLKIIHPGPSTSDLTPTAAVMTAAGDIVINAAVSEAGGMVVWLTNSGAYDTSFGTASGTTHWGYAYGSDVPWGSMAAQEDGKLVIVTTPTSYGAITVSRLLTDGTDDPDFNGGDAVTLSQDGYAYADIAIAASGQILLAYSHSTSEFTYTLLSPDGTASETESMSVTSASARFLAIQADGSTVMVGVGWNPSTSNDEVALGHFEPFQYEFQRLWVEHDANYNITSISTSSGSVIERYEYTPYGERTVLYPDGTPKSGNASLFDWVYGHQGGRLDLITGEWYFRNRDLNSGMERWTQSDPNPAGPYADGSNPYLYVRANPLGGADPLGEFGIKLDFNAFIPLSHGRPAFDGHDFNWGMAPYQNPFYLKKELAFWDWFETDNREDPGDPGTSRLRTTAAFGSKLVGRLSRGPSVTLKAGADPSYKMEATLLDNGNPGTARRVRKKTPKVTSNMTVKDLNASTSTIEVVASDSDPFYTFAPSLAIDVIWAVCRATNGDVTVTVSGKQEEYPAFEGLANTQLVYAYKPNDTTPGPTNMGWFGKTNLGPSSSVTLTN